MKYAAFFVLVLTVCSAGCTLDFYRSHPVGTYQKYMSMTRQRRAPEEGQQVGPPEFPPEEGKALPLAEGEALPLAEREAQPPAAEGEKQPEVIEETRRRVIVQPVRPLFKQDKGELLPRRISVGLSFGNVYGNKRNAISRMHDTDFEDGMLMGLHATYIPAMKKIDLSPHFITRYGIELRIEDHALMLTDNGMHLGKVHTTATVFVFKLLQMPEEGNIFGFHFDVGMGWGNTWFERDTMLKQDDIANGRRTSISTDTAMISTIGVGVDLSIAPDACVSLDLRYEDVPIPIKWRVNGIYNTDMERLNAGSTRLVLSFRYFF